MTPLRLEAPAKVNLALAVTGKRADGYHELVSDLALIELADNLLLMPGCSGLRVDGPASEAVPVEPGANLAWRGLVAGLGGEPELACLSLDKRIPAAAGLGGGSSDAAAAWRLGRAWRGADEAADEGTLAELARVGADVPFFAARHPAARVEGVGERVTPMAAPSADLIVLVHPDFGLSTAEVFAELRPGDWSHAPEEGRNDLLSAARRLRPEIDNLFRLVVGAGGQPQLSGSGPTTFARFDDPARAAAVAARLRRAGLSVTETRLRREAARIEAMVDDQEDP